MDVLIVAGGHGEYTTEADSLIGSQLICPDLPDLPSGFHNEFGSSFNNNGNPVFCEGDEIGGKDCYELTSDFEYVYFGSMLEARFGAGYVQMGEEFWVLGKTGTFTDTSLNIHMTVAQKSSALNKIVLNPILDIKSTKLLIRPYIKRSEVQNQIFF